VLKEVQAPSAPAILGELARHRFGDGSKGFVADAQFADGRADVVEYEAAFELDGDREFDGDCQPGQADSADNSDGICGSQLSSSTLVPALNLPAAQSDKGIE